MKWVKSKKEINARGINDPQERKACFEEITGVPTPSPGTVPPPPIIYIDGKPYYHWVTYPLPISQPGPKHDHFNYHQRSQENYELFCGGWVQFYDSIVKKGDTDHKIYFFWKQYESVTLYIDDPNAQDYIDDDAKHKEYIKNKPDAKYTVVLPYTPPPAGDPPSVPAPPPPYSAT